MLPRGQAPKARSQPGTSCVAHARTVAGACPYNHVVYHGVPFAMTVAMRQAWQEWKEAAQRYHLCQVPIDLP